MSEKRLTEISVQAEVDPLRRSYLTKAAVMVEIGAYIQTSRLTGTGIQIEISFPSPLPGRRFGPAVQ